MKKIIALLLIAMVTTLGLSPLALAQEPTQCEFEYTVQDGDWLSKIAEKYFGDPLSFAVILAVNNADAADNYSDISNADVIEPGWLLCIPSDSNVDTGPQTTSEGLSPEALANATYQSTWTQDGTATLVNGEYSDAAAPGSATMIKVNLTNNIAYGALNGQPYAAVVLVTDSGGSGTFYDLAVVVNQNGQVVNIALTSLGDRVQINSVKIENNEIVIDMVQAGPDDPLCCPSQEVTKRYRLEGDQLLEVTNEAGDDETMMAGDGGLAGTNWVLTSLNGQPVEPGTIITANFGEDGMVTGSTGCNNYNFSYEVDSNNLTISRGPMTLMACPDPVGAQENAYLAALGNTASYQISGDTLELLDAAGNITATFSAVRPVSLTGTQWLIRSYNNGKGGVVSVIIGTELTASFDENGTMSGVAGCNDYSAPYEADAANISIGAAAVTSKVCAEPDGIMTQEAEYLAALPTASTYSIDVDTVNMRTADGATVVNLVAAVTGQVLATAGSTLPDNALIQVQLQDVSLADAPATVLGEQTILSAGNQFPFPFEVTYNPANIDPRLTYALRVRITDAQGQLLYINTQSYQVITNNNPVFGVEVMVDPIQ